MAFISRPKLSKIPGGGMPLASPENHAKDLTKLTHCELMEIKEREHKLLANKTKLNRLPDKGQRIQNLYNKVLDELQRRSHLNEVAAMFSKLNIADTGKKALDHLEWTRELNGNSALDPITDVLDSDDDETEMDPLRLIAQRGMYERKIIELPPEPTLITADDLEDIKTFSAGSSESDPGQQNTGTTKAVDADIVAIDVADKLENIKPKLLKIIGMAKPNSNSHIIKSNSTDKLDDTDTESAVNMEQHVRYLVDIVEADRHPQREKFKPYQTTVSNVHDPEKEKLRKKAKHWEVTAATPPRIQHSGAKLLTLMDSVELQSSYLAKLKELQEQQAIDRLAAKTERLKNRPTLEKLSSSQTLKSRPSFTVYRDPTKYIEGEQSYCETDDVLDPLDEENPRGGVNYTVFE